jgi:valyl-tRNA synthetase
MTNSSTFPQKYDTKEKEAQILKFWEENKIYAFDEKTSKPIFSIDTPPPTMSGKMHAGHAFSYTQTDFIARYKRMSGFEVFYPFGTDDNGLPTEKIVQKEKKINLRKVERKEAVKVVQEYLRETRPSFIQDWKNLGISCDFENLGYSTIDPYSQKISQQSFLTLYKKGLIERRKGPVMWDRQFQTAIAQADLEDKERKAFLNYVKAKVIGSEHTYVIYATTRPELCFGVVGMSVEESGEYVKLKVEEEYWIVGAATYQDKFKQFEYEVVEKLKGSNIINEKVLIPEVEREVIISHDNAVKADFGTGIAYFCTYGGQEDIEWTIRHKAEPYEVLNIYGKLTELGGKYEGQLAENARKEIISDMEKTGSLIFKEEKTQIVNVGERSGVEVEFIVTNQWYGKYLDKKEDFLEAVQEFNWTPEFMKTRVENWIKGLNWDWGFSRQRHFGIPIPIWYCSECEKQVVAEERQLPVDPTQDSCPIDICECGNKEFIPETDVCDTWFTSSSSPIIASKLLGEDMFKKVFPMDLRPQGHDIINTWLFYTMAKTQMEYGINPFKTVNISGFVLASNGTKMSKSKGNGIEPREVVAKFSNDALRFAASSTKLGSDLPYQEKEVKTGAGVTNKIFNAAKFTEMLTSAKEKSELKIKNVTELRSIDQWILSKAYGAIERATNAFESQDYSKAKTEMEGFFMRDIADNYIEIVKQRLWKPEERGEDEKVKAEKSLYYSMYCAARGLAPFMPFVCEEVYQHYFSKFESEKSIHLTSWPTSEKSFENGALEILGDGFVSLVGAVRKFKSEKQVSQKVEIEKFTIECSKEMREFIEDSIDDLKAVTSARVVEFGTAVIETGVPGVKVSIELVQE